MQKTVCRYSNGPIDVELVFDDWTWSHVESLPEELIFDSQELTLAEAIERFECEFKDCCEEPIELGFQKRFPEPFLVYQSGKAFQFDPKGWTLFGVEEIKRDPSWDGFEWSGYAWLFGASESWVEISVEWHVEGFGSDPEFRSRTKQEAADFLIANGYRLPDSLQGYESIQVLSPQNMARLDNDDLSSDSSADAGLDALLDSGGNCNEDGAISRDGFAQQLAEKLSHLADEFRSIRVIHDIHQREKQTHVVMDRFGEAIQSAIKANALPKAIMDKYEKPKGTSLFAAFQAGVSVLGYWKPISLPIVDRTAEGEEFVLDTDEALCPGLISNQWPERFDVIYCGRLGPDESDEDYADRCREENRFEILGRYVHECETMSAWFRHGSSIAMAKCDSGETDDTALGPGSKIDEKSISKLKEERGQWMLENCNPAELSNLSLQAKVNEAAKLHGWPLFDSESGNGAFEAFKRAFLLTYGKPFKRDDRGKSKTAKRSSK